MGEEFRTFKLERFFHVFTNLIRQLGDLNSIVLLSIRPTLVWRSFLSLPNFDGVLLSNLTPNSIHKPAKHFEKHRVTPSPHHYEERTAVIVRFHRQTDFISFLLGEPFSFSTAPRRIATPDSDDALIMLSRITIRREYAICKETEKHRERSYGMRSVPCQEDLDS